MTVPDSPASERRPARGSRFARVLLPLVAIAAGIAFLAACGAEATPSLARLATGAERLLRCPPDRAPPGFQFFRLLRAVAFLPLLLSTTALWCSRLPREKRTEALKSALVPLIVLFGCFLRVDLWATKSFWCDTWALEAGISTHTAAELLAGPLGFNQSAPVGFSLLAKALGSCPGGSGAVLTLPLLLASCLVLALLSHLAKDRLRAPLPIAALFAFLFAVNPSFVYYGAEFKPYGTDLLMSTLALSVWFRFESGRARHAELLLFSILAPLFSLPSFFVLPFLYLALLVRSRRDAKAALRIVLCGAAALPVAAFALLHAFATMPAAMDNVQDLFAPVAFTKEAASWWIGRILHSFRGPAYFGFSPWSVGSPAVLLSAIPLGLFLAGAWRARREPWLWMALGAIAATAFASACRYWKINPGASLTSGRLVLFLAPFAYLPLVRGLEWAAGSFPRGGLAIAAFASLSAVLFFAQQTPHSCPTSELGSCVSAERNANGLVIMDEILLLSLLHEDPELAARASDGIRMVYSDASYDDRQFAALDRFLPGMRRFPVGEEGALLDEVGERLSAGGRFAAFLYPSHARSLAFAEALAGRFGGAAERPGWYARVRSEPEEEEARR